MSTASRVGKSCARSGAGWKRFGPIHEKKEARSEKTGSIRMRFPPTSRSTLEWPSQTNRAEAEAGSFKASFAETTGRGCFGTLSLLPLKRNRYIVFQYVPGFITAVGSVFTNTPSLWFFALFMASSDTEGFEKCQLQSRTKP